MLNFVYAAFAYIFVSSILERGISDGRQIRRRNAFLVVDCNFLGMISTLIFFFFFSPPPCIFLLELHSLSYLCNCLCVSCWVCVGKIFDLRQIDTHELIKKWFVIAYKCIRNFHIFQNQKKVALSVYFKWLSLRKVSEACITLQL